MDQDSSAYVLGGEPVPTSESDLKDRLRELFQTQPSLEEFAGRALEWTAEFAKSPMASLLLLHSGSGQLSVAAARGVDAAGRAALAGPGAWPLIRESLENRRVHVIQISNDNSVVPSPIARSVGVDGALAILPFYQDGQASGVALLGRPDRDGFDDALLRTLNQVLRGCASAFSGLPEVPGSDLSLQAPLLDGAASPTVATSAEAFGDLVAHVNRLSQLTEQARSAFDGKLEQTEALANELQAERERSQLLAERLPIVESQLAEAKLLAATAAELESQGQSNRRALEDAEGRVHEMQRQLRDLEAQKVASEARAGSLTEECDDLRGRVQESREATAKVRSLERLLRETDERARASEAREKELASDLDDMRDQWRDAERSRDHNARRVRELEARLGTLERLEQEVVTLEARLLDREVRVRTLEAMAENVGHAAEAVRLLEVERDDLAGRLQAEIEASQLRDRLDGDERTRSGADSSGTEPANAGAATPGPTAQSGEPGESAGITVRPVLTSVSGGKTRTAAAVPESGPTPTPVPPASGAGAALLVFDGLAIAPGEQNEQSTLSDADAFAQALGANAPRSLAVNLFQAGALRVLRSIARAGVQPPTDLFLYGAQGPGAPLLWVGRSAVAILPDEMTKVVERLYWLAPEMRRAVTMSRDMDLMRDLRTRLAESKISASAVFDVRQVEDLVPLVRPEAALIHCSPDNPECTVAISTLRNDPATARTPILIALDAKAAPSEDASIAAQAKKSFERCKRRASDLAELLEPARKPR